MGFFTIGNLITLGILILSLILYRQLDKNNHSLDKVRKYADRLKGDLAAYVEEKAAEVKNFGLTLDVERKSAAQLMKKLQQMTEEELAQKAQAIVKIDERIRAYDASLEELVKMTARVQENLGRIREESAFVENASKRVAEAKEEFGLVRKGMAELERRFERENAEALAGASEAVLAAVRSTVSDLELSAETIGRKVEDHREAVDKIEKERALGLARDMALINKTLKEAVEKAGFRADKMEEAALVKLRDQAQERVQRFRAFLEEKLKSAQEGSRLRIAEIQELLRDHREEWKAEHGEIEARQKQYRDEWKKDMQELGSLAKQQKDDWAALSKELGDAARAQREAWDAAAAETERKVLESSDARLEQYKAVQAEEFRQLERLADDMAKLDGELRLSMAETESRVRQDFARFEEASLHARQGAAAEFEAHVQDLKARMAEVEQELNALKNTAYANVSEKLKVFEDDFAADLSRRGADIDRALSEWQAGLDARIAEMADRYAAERQEAETALAGEVRKSLSGQGERLIAELEQLKAETGAFEEGMREQMRSAEEERHSFMEQLGRDLAEARGLAEESARAEIGKYALSMAESLKQNRRDLEERLRDIAALAEKAEGDVQAHVEASRRSVEEWQNTFNVRLRELDADMEDLRRRTREAAAENDGRIGQIRSAIEELGKDLSARTRLFEQTNELKRELELRIEDLNGDIDRLDQRKNEIRELENEIVRVKRLEEDVNAKMTRFLTEQRRFEIMEGNFNRILLTAQGVEDKLAQVSSSDDTLQAVQIQLRRLDEAIKETEEKYQRVERKSQVLDETNDGIDRNFKNLEETERTVRKINDELEHFQAEFSGLRASIEILSGENEKARETVEKLSALDEALSHIEKRIEDMQVAREWLANLETRMDESYKQSLNNLRLAGDSIRKERGGKTRPKSASSIADRENVLKLARQGWKVEEIADTMRISQGEVQLILETSSRD